MPKEPVEIRLPKQDYLSLLAAMVAAGSVFFPWFNIEVVTSYSGYTNHQLYGTFKGTYVEGGWAGLSLSLFCVVMIFLRNKWGSLTGLCNVLIGLSYLLGWVDLSSKFLATRKDNALLLVEPQNGLYMFIVSSLVCSVLIIRTHYASRVF